MKRTILIVSVLGLLCLPSLAVNQSVISREDISLKAGPTNPGEEITMVWVEAYVFPKVVQQNRIVSLGVRLTTKVKEVKATFDFSQKPVHLFSDDGLQWSGAFEIPPGVKEGLHVANYQMSSKKGKINRTVDFFLDGSVELADDSIEIAEGEVFDVEGWPLTVNSNCVALAEGASRILFPGQEVTGLSKVPWYKVIFADGEEGWILASNVDEPLDDFCTLGYKAYSSGDFEQAVKYYKKSLVVNKDFVKGHFWLAKSYNRMGKLDAAYRSIMTAMRLDERDINNKKLANVLALSYYKLAHARFEGKEYNKAIAAYKKVLDLAPSSTTAWLEMGRCLDRLGFQAEAKAAWQEALATDPENPEIYALLDVNVNVAVTPAELGVQNKKQKTVAALPKTVVKGKEKSSATADSLGIVRSIKTNKGTEIEVALKSVVALTKSLGTPVVEKGWEVKKKGKKYLARYICEQGSGVNEAFEWLVNTQTKRAIAHNENAQVLMSRW